MKMLRTTPSALIAITLVANLCLWLPLVADAQEIPNPKPGKAHQLFAKNAGTWDCAVKMFFNGPDAPPTESKGIEVNKLVSGGLYMQTSFTCKMGDRQFEGHALLGFDPRTKKYVGTWVDNFSSVPTQPSGEYNEEKKIYTVHSTVVDLASGQELKQKQITTWADQSKKTFEIFLVVQAGDKELDVKLMEMTAVKRK